MGNRLGMIGWRSDDQNSSRRRPHEDSLAHAEHSVQHEEDMLRVRQRSDRDRFGDGYTSFSCRKTSAGLGAQGEIPGLGSPKIPSSCFRLSLQMATTISCQWGEVLTHRDGHSDEEWGAGEPYPLFVSV